MGKAYSDKEKKQIMERLTKTGLKLLRDAGIKKMSIQLLTKKAGISQGGFYNFFKDKEEFIFYLIRLRILEKLELRKKHFHESLEDPIGYLIDMFYSEGVHLKENKAFNNTISSSIDFYIKYVYKTGNTLGVYYEEFLKQLKTFWKENGIHIEMDMNGLASTILGEAILFMNCDLIDREGNTFNQILKNYVESNIRCFVKRAL